jgi:hypothetical protein
MRVCSDVIEDGVDMALFVLRSMFTADEKLVFDEIVESRSFKGLIANAADNRHPLTGSGDNFADSPSPFG